MVVHISNHERCEGIWGEIDQYQEEISWKAWRMEGLMWANAILMGVVVCISAYAPRYRRHPVIGLVFLGANTLFLPIFSVVVTTYGNIAQSSTDFLGVAISCPLFLGDLAFVWAGVVVIIGINTSVVVACDAREGRGIEPPTELLIKAIWFAYLTVSIDSMQYPRLIHLLIALIFSKLFAKYLAFYKARRSVVLGFGPRLIAGYMGEDTVKVGDDLPRLVVMGEHTVKVDDRPHGSIFKGTTEPDRQGDRSVVTLDQVWQLLQGPTSQQPKDLCFSFALFKLLRCRFAKYTVSEAGFIKAQKFFRDTLLQGDGYERAFRVITDELSFIHDYYFSSRAVSYSHPLLAILDIALSVCTMAYCLFPVFIITDFLIKESSPSIDCYVFCYDEDKIVSLGSIFSAAVPAYLVIVMLFLSEMRDIATYICGNWTKVYLIYRYVSQASRQRSPAVPKHIRIAFKYCRCKLLQVWQDKINQCTPLVLPRQTKIPLVHRLLRPSRHTRKKVKVPSAVKSAIFKELQREGLTSEQDGGLKHIRPPSPLVSGSAADTLLSAKGEKNAAYTILVWHVATALFEVRRRSESESESELSHRVVATHLSRYCAYLVASHPELLPGDDEWCKKLYAAVKKDADRVLPAAAPARKAEYGHLVRRLRQKAKHDVLKDGAELAERLVGSAATTTAGWEAVARYWAGMILYLAPSENLEGHADAISRGGELITLLWAMLAHAGVVGRVAAAAATSAAPV
ncbi:hypothetical protein ACP4OV_012216 [Aristida adscensionis]